MLTTDRPTPKEFGLLVGKNKMVLPEDIGGYHDDVCYDGCAVEHPSATHWCPHTIPQFPASGEF